MALPGRLAQPAPSGTTASLPWGGGALVAGVMHQAVPDAGPGSRVPWHHPGTGTHAGWRGAGVCPHSAAAACPHWLGVAGGIISRRRVRGLSSVIHPSVLLPGLTSRDLVPQTQQLRISRRVGGWGPSGGLGRGRPGKKSCVMRHLSCLSRWRQPGGSWGSLPGAE